MEPTNEEKYRKAMEAMQIQLARMKNDLDIRSKEADDLKSKHSAFEEENKKLRTFYDQQINERRDKYTNLYQNDIATFLTEVGKTDPNVANHVSSLDTKLRDVVRDGVIDPIGEDQIVVLQACASIQKHTSSHLDKLLKGEKEWAQKYEQLAIRLNEMESKNKDLENKHKEAIRERDEIKSKFHSSVLNSIIPEDTVTATASASAPATNTYSERDFSSLFARQPTSEWRSLFPEPQPYRK